MTDLRRDNLRRDGSYPRVDRTAAGSSDGCNPGLSRNVRSPIRSTPEISHAQPTSHRLWQKDNSPMRNTTVPTSPAMPVPKELIAFSLPLSHSGCISTQNATESRPTQSVTDKRNDNIRSDWEEHSRPSRSHRDHSRCLLDPSVRA